MVSRVENYPSIRPPEARGSPLIYVLADGEGHIILEAASSGAASVDVTRLVRRFADTGLQSLVAEVDGIVVRLERRGEYIVAASYLEELDGWYAFVSRLLSQGSVPVASVQGSGARGLAVAALH